MRVSREYKWVKRSWRTNLNLRLGGVIKISERLTEKQMLRIINKKS